MNRKAKTILIVVAVAVAAYLAYRWYQNRQAAQGQTTTGLGSNLNSPAPELSAAPSVGPAVQIPVTISIAHSASEAPPESANPYGRMISNPAEHSPLSGTFGRAIRPASHAALFRSPEDLDTDKDTDSPYSTTMGPG